MIQKTLAFSLIELLVVIAITAILAAIAAPVYNYYAVRAKIAALIPMRDILIRDAQSYYATHGTLPPSGTGDGYGGLSNLYNVASISPYLVVYTGQVAGIYRYTPPPGSCPYTVLGFMIDGNKLASSSTPIFNTTFGFTNNGDTNMMDFRTIVWVDNNGVWHTYCGEGGNSSTQSYKYLPTGCQNPSLLSYTPTC